MYSEECRKDTSERSHGNETSRISRDSLFKIMLLEILFQTELAFCSPHGCQSASEHKADSFPGNALYSHRFMLGFQKEVFSKARSKMLEEELPLCLFTDLFCLSSLWDFRKALWLSCLLTFDAMRVSER